MSHTGYVKFFDDVKGFGFIQPVDGSICNDIYVDARDVAGNPLYTDDRVTFDLHVQKGGGKGGKGGKGAGGSPRYNAKNVKGGTGNPVRGKMKGELRRQEFAAKHGEKGGVAKGKGGGIFKGGGGGFSKGGAAGGNNPGNKEEDDEEEGKGNGGKGFCPGAAKEWVKGGEGGVKGGKEGVPPHAYQQYQFQRAPQQAQLGAHASLIAQMLGSATGPDFCVAEPE